MFKRPVFYSFHYENDFWRTQQIRNMGAFDNSKPVQANDWENLKRKGGASIRNWIDKQIEQCACTIVLVGSATAGREWIDYEIEKTWNEKKGLLGVRIHNLKDDEGQTDNAGRNPFEGFLIGNHWCLDGIVPLRAPSFIDPYNDIRYGLADWVEEAIAIRENLEHTIPYVPRGVRL